MTTDGPSLTDLADLAEQRADLRAAADRVLRDEWSLDGRADLLDGDEPAWAPKLWHTLTELGWSELLVPSSGGGSIGDLCVLAEAVGAAVAPVPLVTAAVAGWAEGSGAGQLVVVVDGPRAEARPVAGGLVISGSWPLVEYGQVADRLLVPVALDGGRQAVVGIDVAAPGVARTAVRPLDAGPSAAVVLDDVVVEVGTDDDRATGLEQRLLLARVAELVGVAAGANAAAVEYAKQRITFGRPIGANQAIKHRLVDQRVAVEVARALVDRAADAVERRAPDAAACTAMAAAWAASSLRAVPEGALQVFGGIGYTWEHPIHLFLRRAAVLTALVGPPARHRQPVVDWLVG